MREAAPNMKGAHRYGDANDLATGEEVTKRVTGVGGIFCKAKDAEKLRAWYREHLGIESEGIVKLTIRACRRPELAA